MSATGRKRNVRFWGGQALRRPVEPRTEMLTGLSSPLRVNGQRRHGPQVTDEACLSCGINRTFEFKANVAVLRRARQMVVYKDAHSSFAFA